MPEFVKAGQDWRFRIGVLVLMLSLSLATVLSAAHLSDSEMYRPDSTYGLSVLSTADIDEPSGSTIFDLDSCTALSFCHLQLVFTGEMEVGTRLQMRSDPLRPGAAISAHGQAIEVITPPPLMRRA